MMADEEEANKFISKANKVFPEYLDWEKLRDEGRDYLGKFSGKLWTDHNTHDPGITILEMLCYAIMDLGYRTNLPDADIFARKPDDTSAKDNNFFTPSQILACNPVTIMDFRKMLIDITGVKNAWLENSFYNCNDSKNTNPGRKETDCSGCYNGLYHVYIELENNYNLKIDKEKEEYEKLIDKIKSRLMSHRNLCEDFIDLHILCKKEIGVCVDIELNTGVNPEDVYVKAVEKLRDFFSPSPEFYTLPQLLEKNKFIEDIFAGRPYDIKESHGFVDTEEFEQIKLKKEIHLSDVYHVIFDTEGVKSVRNLGWKNCNETSPKQDWVFPLPENHIPDFSVDCSMFRFFRNGILLKVDTEKFAELFKMDFRHNGKVLYKADSPYLDAEKPGAFYRDDLGEYYSIQNEFPVVYGIGEGGLSNDAPPGRKAQAYQLKAYLLFFDQLLAAYVGQLKNIRSLFSFSSPASKDDSRTYFFNESELSSVPDLDKFLRFKTNKNSESIFGMQGSVLAFPASKKKLEELVENDGIKKIKFINDIERFSFNCTSECDIEVNSLMQDLLYGDYNPVICSNENNCWFFYLFTSSGQIALISNTFYASENEAANAAASVKYIGAFRENLRTSITAQNKFSFYMELNFSGYAVYLQQIHEDETLYRKRRDGFLNHLLSRFAERFTDFAILSYKFLDERELERQEIVKKENFLTHYDDLSSNRGRAYDYLSSGWNNENISGFEKRVAALAGIEDFKKHSLCNFVVQEKENGFVIKIKFRNAEEVFFVYKENIYSDDFAKKCAKEIFIALNTLENYQVIYDEILAEWRIKIFFKNTRQVYYCFNFQEQETALAVCNGLHKLFSSSLSENDVHKYGEVFKCIVTNSLNEKICSSKEPKKENEKDAEFLSRLAKQIIQPGNWDFMNAEPINFEQIYLDNRIGEKLSFIDLKPFIINIYNADKARRGKFKYDVKDNQDNFKLNSTSRFSSYDEAFKDCCRLLIHLTDVANYYIVYRKSTKKYLLQIKYDNRLVAESGLKYNSEPDAVNALNEINRLAKQHLYFLSIEKPPPSWDFTFLLGYKKDEQFYFRSEKQFATEEEAWEAGNNFYKNLPGSIVKINDAGKIILEQSITQSTCVCVSTQKSADKENINSLLLLKAEIDSYMREKEKEEEEGATGLFEQFVAPEEVSDPALKFVYRLVDKDLLRAFYFYGTTADYDINDKNSAEEKKIELFQDPGNYSHTEIYLSGDIIKKYPNSENPEWFHYQVKCSNKYNGVEGFVLFESVIGYVSEEEARKAFDENLHTILSNAMKADQYGEDVFISIEEKRIHETDACIRNKNVVFIPDGTKEIIRQNDADVIESLVIIAKKYPVRTITRDDNEFYALFPCERDERIKTENDGCISKTKTASLLYYFVLSDEEGVEKWQSVNYFHTFMEAMQQFNFFLMLLEYPGNYCVQQDYCGCKWKIYIREVLAESKRKFPDKRTAWGGDGIEKFICISQSENSFQTYENENCCFSFNVSNGNMGLLHPCTYHTDKQRNEAIRKLYEGAKDEEVWKFPEIKSGESNECVLYDRDGNGFASISYNNQQNSSGTAPADGCLCMAELIYYGGTTGFEKKGEDISVKLGDKTSVVISRIDREMGFEEWEKIFFKICCQYPVVKKNNDTKFYIEFKLPGFSCCNDEFNEQEPCGGTDKNETASCKCCIAWKSECCFESCYDAISFLIKNKDCLLDLSNYSPVFDCECGPFGIKLNCACGVDDRTGGDHTYKYSRQPAGSDEDGNRNPECCSEIVAFNPQCYLTPKMDCDAVVRAKKIINSEGLHLAEHILLRPRCPEDCNENGEINCPVKICDDKDNDMTKCKFPEFKESGEDDPCDVRKSSFKFKPGEDPYSFIATIALPAWTPRFSNKEYVRVIENKKVFDRGAIETLIYREAPAHILLRILWLTPHDMCCFEEKFKKWNLWLSQKTPLCIDQHANCEFIEYLFTTKFECTDEPDCTECVPCPDKTTVSVPCFNDAKEECGNFNLGKKINDLYCWEQCSIIEEEMVFCDEINDQAEEGTLQKTRKLKPETEKPKKKKIQKPVEEKKESNEAGLAGKEIKPPGKGIIADPHALMKFYRRRQSNWLDDFSKIIPVKNGGDPLIQNSVMYPVRSKALAILKNPNPGTDWFINEVQGILNEKAKTKGVKEKLTVADKNSIVEIVLCSLFDRICSGEAKEMDVKKLASFINANKKQINSKKVFKRWRYDDYSENNIDADIEKLKNILPLDNS